LLKNEEEKESRKKKYSTYSITLSYLIKLKLNLQFELIDLIFEFGNGYSNKYFWICCGIHYEISISEFDFNLNNLFKYDFYGCTIIALGDCTEQICKCFVDRDQKEFSFSGKKHNYTITKFVITGNLNLI
jgi:hypothetical protein